MIKSKTLIIILTIIVFYTVSTIIAYRNIKYNILISEKQEKEDYDYVDESSSESF